MTSYIDRRFANRLADSLLGELPKVHLESAKLGAALVKMRQHCKCCGSVAESTGGYYVEYLQGKTNVFVGSLPVGRKVNKIIVRETSTDLCFHCVEVEEVKDPQGEKKDANPLDIYVNKISSNETEKRKF